MKEVYIQYHITKPDPNGVAHRTGFMTERVLREWLADGWTVFTSYPGTRLGKSKKGFLVPLSMADDPDEATMDGCFS